MTTHKTPETPRANELMRRVANGNWEALRELYQRYSSGVYHLAQRRLNDKRAAEEVVQDIFLRVWHHASRWDETRGSAQTWILVIARSIIYDYLRSCHNKESWLGDEMLDRIVDPSDPINEFIDLESLNEMLAQLPQEQRQIVKMVYVDGWPSSRIAQTLNLPVGTVKSRLRLALDHLRRQLEKEAHSDGAL